MSSPVSPASPQLAAADTQASATPTSPRPVKCMSILLEQEPPSAINAAIDARIGSYFAAMADPEYEKKAKEKEQDERKLLAMIPSSGNHSTNSGILSPCEIRTRDIWRLFKKRSQDQLLGLERCDICFCSAIRAYPPRPIQGDSQIKSLLDSQAHVEKQLQAEARDRIRLHVSSCWVRHLLDRKQDDPVFSWKELDSRLIASGISESDLNDLKNRIARHFLENRFLTKIKKICKNDNKELYEFFVSQFKEARTQQTPTTLAHTRVRMAYDKEWASKGAKECQEAVNEVFQDLESMIKSPSSISVPDFLDLFKDFWNESSSVEKLFASEVQAIMANYEAETWKLIKESILDWYKVHMLNRFDLLFNTHLRFIRNISFLKARLIEHKEDRLIPYVHLLLEQNVKQSMMVTSRRKKLSPNNASATGGASLPPLCASDMKAKEATGSQQKPVYRQLQGKHQLNVVCAAHIAQMSALIGSIASKTVNSRFTTYDYAHIAPFPGIFSWSHARDKLVEDLSVQFFERMDIRLRQDAFGSLRLSAEERSQRLSHENEAIQALVIRLLINYENKKDAVKDILSIISSVYLFHLSQTAHCVKWCNDIDHASEPVNYKKNLGAALLNLIANEDSSKKLNLKDVLEANFKYILSVYDDINKRETQISMVSKNQIDSLTTLLTRHMLLSTKIALQEILDLNQVSLQEKKSAHEKERKRAHLEYCKSRAEVNRKRMERQKNESDAKAGSGASNSNNSVNGQQTVNSTNSVKAHYEGSLDEDHFQGLHLLEASHSLVPPVAAGSS